MKLSVKTICKSICLFVWALAPAAAFAVSFVKIENVDALTDFPKIHVTASVKDTNSRFISGLDESSFMIYEDGYRVNYVKTANKQELGEQAYVVFCIDSSKSLSAAFLNDIKNAATDILSGCNAAKTALYQFNDAAELMHGFGADVNSIISSINSIRRSGSKTMLYNCIYDAIQLLEDAGAKNRAVVVFTDGIDDGSSVQVRDILHFSKDTATPVFFISRKNGDNLSSLERMAKLTGGQLVNCNKRAEIKKMYENILASVTSKYIITYHSLLNPDGKKHNLELRLAAGNVRDRDTTEFTVSRSLLAGKFFNRDNLLLYVILALLLLALIIILILAIKQRRANNYKVASTSGGGEPVREYASLVIPGLGNGETAEEEAASSRAVSKYSNAWLIQKDGSETGKKFTLFRGETIIGSEPDCGLIVYDASVSPVHAKIKNINGVFYIFDLISEGGTFLNGKKLLRPKVLYDWDEIAIGRAKFIFRGSKIIG